MPSGQTIAIFDALSSRPPATGFAQLDLRNGRPVIDFDDSLTESALFAGVAPSTYSGGDLTARVTFTAATAASGVVLWGIAVERAEPNATNLDTDVFGAESTAATPAPTTTGTAARADLSLPVASLGGLLAGEPYRLRLRRIADDPLDTAAGDAELMFVELVEA